MQLENIKQKFGGYNLLLIICWSILVISSFGRGIAGRIEGTFFPVVTPLQITSVKESEFGSVIDGNFTKIRDCDFVNIVLRLKDGSKSTSLFSLVKVQEAREIGEHKMENLFVNTTPDNVDNTEGYIIHNCHSAYTTESAFLGKR